MDPLQSLCRRFSFLCTRQRYACPQPMQNCTMSHNLPQICTKTKCIHQYQQRESNTKRSTVRKVQSPTYTAGSRSLRTWQNVLHAVNIMQKHNCQNQSSKRPYLSLCKPHSMGATNDHTCHFANPIQDPNPLEEHTALLVICRYPSAQHALGSHWHGRPKRTGRVVSSVTRRLESSARRAAAIEPPCGL